MLAIVGVDMMRRALHPVDITVDERLARTAAGTQQLRGYRWTAIVGSAALMFTTGTGHELAILLPIGAFMIGGWGAYRVHLVRLRRFRGPVIWDELARSRRLYRSLGGARGTGPRRRR